MKKILTTGIILMTMAPHAFAEEATSEISSHSNQNEENLLLSSAPNTKDTTPKISVDNTAIWKMVHCEIVKQGLEWTLPTAFFANKNTCNAIGTNLGDQNRLNAQRQLVQDYIAQLNQKKMESNSDMSFFEQTKKVVTFLENIKKEIASISYIENKQLKTTLEKQEYIKYLSENDIKIFQKMQGFEHLKGFELFKKEYYTQITKLLTKINQTNPENTLSTIKNTDFPLLYTLIQEYKNITDNEAFLLDNSVDVYKIFQLKIGEKSNFSIPFIWMTTKTGDTLSFDDYDISVQKNELWAAWNTKRKSLDFSYASTKENVWKEYIVNVIFTSKKDNKQFSQDIVLINAEANSAHPEIHTFTDYHYNHVHLDK